MEQILKRNETEVYVVSLENMETLWTQHVAAIGRMTLDEAKCQWVQWRVYFSNTADYASAGTDTE